MGNIQNLDVQIPHEIIQYWGWFLAFGIALLLLGVVAVFRSVTATIVSMLFFGWLLLFASGIEIAQAVMVGHWVGSLAGRNSVWRYRFDTRNQTSARRRGRDGFHGYVLPDRRGFFNLSGRPGLRCQAGVGRHWTDSSRLCWVYLFWRNGPLQGFG